MNAFSSYIFIVVVIAGILLILIARSLWLKRQEDKLEERELEKWEPPGDWNLSTQVAKTFFDEVLYTIDEWRSTFHRRKDSEKRPTLESLFQDLDYIRDGVKKYGLRDDLFSMVVNLIISELQEMDFYHEATEVAARYNL